MMDDRCKIRTLAAEWSRELGTEEIGLAIALIVAHCDGEYGSLPLLFQATFYDDKRMMHVPLSHDLVNSSYKRDASLNWYQGRALAAWISAGWYHIHKDAVSLFVERRPGVAMPLRWTRQPPVATAVSVAKLRELLISVADGVRKQSEVEQIVKVRLGGVPRKMFRDAWEALPDDLKRSRGDTDRTVLAKRR